MNICIFNKTLEKESNTMMNTKDTDLELYLVEEGKE